jgi:site-specific DNA-methyltransferase (adenine-specific)
VQSKEVDISLLKENERNPRFITETKFAALVQSITDYPEGNWLKPIIVDGDYKVIGGNQRLRAYRHLNYKKVWVTQDPEMTDKAKKAWVIMDNGHFGEWDEDLLWADYEPEDVESWGVDHFPHPKDTDDVVEDNYDVDEKPETKFKFSTVCHIGEHKLVCGDSTKKESWELLMGSETKAHMIHTDPPYNVAYGSQKNPRHKQRAIANDDMGEAEWEKFCHAWIQHMDAYNEGDAYVWGASGPHGILMRAWLIQNGLHWSATIIWKKDKLVLGRANYQRLYEPCFYGWSGTSSFVGDRKQVDVWDFDRPRASKEHPTMKPVELCGQAISLSSKRGDIVLDPFLGSGSTMVAAHQLGRKCVGIEMDPGYCQVIVNRMLSLDPTLKVTYENANE